jgi:hypothetical protein
MADLFLRSDSVPKIFESTLLRQAPPNSAYTESRNFVESNYFIHIRIPLFLSELYASLSLVQQHNIPANFTLPSKD